MRFVSISVHLLLKVPQRSKSAYDSGSVLMEYLSSVEEQFKGTSKVHASTLILKMLTTKYEWINYNTQKEKWKMSECVQEEKRLKVEKLDVVHVTTTNSNKRKGSSHGKGSSGDNSTPNKGFRTIRRLERNQRTVKVGNGVDLNVEAIGTLSLILECGFCLNLYGTLYVSSMTRNLIYVSKLIIDDFIFTFGYNKVYISLNSRVVGNGCLERNLFKLCLDNQFLKSLLSFNVNENVNLNKRKQDPETSSKLWHQRLGHISQDRMTRLVKDEVLLNFNFSDFEKMCRSIKGKMTKGNKKGATRSTRLLELIHTDICGPFPSSTGGHKSFITFIDDYSRYMYLFLINEKSESLEMFKTFKAEVENQLNRKIKVVRSDRGGEYYGRHTDVGQALGSFFNFCKDHGIINQYTLPGTPQQNGVAERRNRTLMDMVRSMLANSNIPKFLWTGALKTNWDETPIIHVPIPISMPLDTLNDHLIAQDHPNNVEENEPNPGINVEPQKTQQPLPHFDLELHQMDVKTEFLNGDLHEDVYMAQPQGFKSKGQEHLVCKLKKSIYGLKQASRQWYLKFDEVMKKHNFIKNQVDQCVYLKMSGSNFIILVLYVDDILLASNNIDLLHESKRFLSRNFDMKDLGEASYVIGIEIHRDRANGRLGLSQKAYIERILNRFNMQHCSPTVAPVIKGDVFGSHQYIAYICGMLGMFQSNPDLLHWKAAKKVIYDVDTLKVIGYLDSDFAKCKDTSRSTLGYIFMLSGGPVLGRVKNKPLKIYCDNSAAVSFSNSNSSTGAGLYLDTKYLFVRERVERICIEHIRTYEMLADPLTKGLTPKVFQGHVAKIGFR
ncbi:putative RNA-directed DNA polymerase [Tanacetum coccineum]